MRHFSGLIVILIILGEINGQSQFSPLLIRDYLNEYNIKLCYFFTCWQNYGKFLDLYYAKHIWIFSRKYRISPNDVKNGHSQHFCEIEN
jgi:hypothetical protein